MLTNSRCGKGRIVYYIMYIHNTLNIFIVKWLWNDEGQIGGSMKSKKCIYIISKTAKTKKQNETKRYLFPIFISTICVGFFFLCLLLDWIYLHSWSYVLRSSNYFQSVCLHIWSVVCFYSSSCSSSSFFYLVKHLTFPFFVPYTMPRPAWGWNWATFTYIQIRLKWT